MKKPALRIKFSIHPRNQPLSAPVWGKHLAFSIFLFVLAYFLAARPAFAATDELYFLHPDHLGSTRAVTDRDGNVVARYDYWPYGATNNEQLTPALSSAGQATDDRITERRFTSQIYDQVSDLYFYNSRYYNPALGTFISPDPVQGPNRYAYVSGNPINMIDPSGNMVDVGGGGGGGAELSQGAYEVYLNMPAAAFVGGEMGKNLFLLEYRSQLLTGGGSASVLFYAGMEQTMLNWSLLLGQGFGAWQGSLIEAAGPGYSSPGEPYKFNLPPTPDGAPTRVEKMISRLEAQGVEITRLGRWSNSGITKEGQLFANIGVEATPEEVFHEGSHIAVIRALLKAGMTPGELSEWGGPARALDEILASSKTLRAADALGMSEADIMGAQINIEVWQNELIKTGAPIPENPLLITPQMIIDYYRLYGQGGG